MLWRRWQFRLRHENKIMWEKGRGERERSQLVQRIDEMFVAYYSKLSRDTRMLILLQ